MNGHEVTFIALNVAVLLAAGVMAGRGSRAARRAMIGLLVVLSAWWSTLWFAALADSESSRCVRSHEGELESLIASVLWTASLVVIAARWEFTGNNGHVATRALLPVVTAALIAGSYVYVVAVKPTCS